MTTNENFTTQAVGAEIKNDTLSEEDFASEHETIVNMNSGERIVRIWTSQHHVIQRLRKDKRFTEVTDFSRCTANEAEFTIPRSEWTPWGGAKHRRQMTDEQRAATAERFRKIREANK